jgi:TetR/AcrR family tetracycline transcriptional repressor
VALDRQRIVTEAVALLDDAGLDGVTLRKLAARLGVQAPTLYWHLRNKTALINAIADEILAAEFGELKPAGDEPWQIWLAGVATRFRRAMLAHPDGARVVSAAHLSTTMADVSETAIRSLVEQGVPLRRARLTVLAIEQLTIGYVLDEQAPRPSGDDLTGFDMAAFAEAHPTLIAGITDYFQDGRDVDTLFRDTLRILLE